MWDLRIFDFIQIFIFSIFSFAISMFISDKFKLSNNKFIKILQKLVFTNIIIALFGLIGYLLVQSDSIFNTIFCENDDEIEVQVSQDNNKKGEAVGGAVGAEKDIVQITSNIGDKDEEYYSFKIKKDIIESVWEKGTDIIVSGVKDLGPNLGIGAAVGKVGSEVIKNTAGMAPAPRVAMLATSALVTAAGTKIGIELGKALIENKKIDSEIEANTLNTDGGLDGRNSPTEFDGGFIQSVLEQNEIPLVSMVNGLCYLNYIEFILILSLFSLLFRKYLIRKLIGFIAPLSLKLKTLSPAPSASDTAPSANELAPKEGSWCYKFWIRRGKFKYNKKKYVNNTLNNVDKYTDYLTVFIFLCLIWIKFINIYFSSNLAADIDSFVNVYNHIKHNSFSGLLFSLPYGGKDIFNNWRGKNLNKCRSPLVVLWTRSDSLGSSRSSL